MVSRITILFGRRASLLLGTLMLTALAYVGDAQEKAKTDQAGDPLPQGAIARMGTLRWRHAEAVAFVAYTADGKGVVTASNDNTVRLWDRHTGKEIRRFEMPAVPVQPGVRPVGFNAYGRSTSRIALSHDGAILAAVLNNSRIQLWDVSTGKPIREIDSVVRLVNTIAFAPDDKIVAARGFDRTTYLYSTETGKEIRQIKGKQAQPGGAVRILGAANGFDPIAFSADGKIIASVESIFDMQKVTTSLILSETDTGKEVRKIDLAGNLANATNAVAAIAFSPNGKVLAYGAGNSIQLREPDTGKEIRSIDQAGGVSGLTFSPNSETLAARGRDQTIRLYETVTGKTLHTLASAAAPGPNAAFMIYNVGESRDLSFSPDGKTLAIGGGQALRFFTVANGKEQAAGGGHAGPVSAVVLTPDGKTMISRGGDNVIRRWDARTGQALGQFAEPKGTAGAAFSPDGKMVALVNADSTIRLHNIADGAELHQLRGHSNGIESVAFSPDSKIVASRGSVDGTIRLHDAAQGTLVKQITLPGANVAGGGAVFIGRSPYGTATQALAFSADGQTLATNVNASDVRVRNPGGIVQPGAGSTIHFWDVATGKEIRKIPLPANRTVRNIAFSPDGRVLAAENTDQTLSLWEIASGRERAVLGTPGANQPGQPGVGAGGGFAVAGRVAAGLTTATLAYSPDGTLIALRHADRSVRVWEVAHTKEVGRFTGHDGAVNAIAFARDGKSLASASADTTLLVWDLTRLDRAAKAEAVSPTAKEMDDLWADLVGDDAGKAWRGIQTLSRAGKETPAIMRERLKPATPPDVQKLDQWINDLDNINFAKRMTAAAELEKLGELAVPALRKVLDSKPSPEVRRRVEPILEKLTTGVLTAEQIRAIRAIEALEQLANAEARQMLEALAQGAPGAVPTRHAHAALARLIAR